MFFTSISFFVFLSVVWSLYYLLPKQAQPYLLLVANVYFYLCSGILEFFYLCTTICTVFFSGTQMARCWREEKEEVALVTDRNEKRERKAFYKKRRKPWLYGCLCLNLGLLAGVKYCGFFLENVQAFLGFFGYSSTLSTFRFLVPLGISFYTFQSISYLLDVYWGKIEGETDFLNYVLYASFFPQMIQGPITRYQQVREVWRTPRSFQLTGFYQAVLRITYGFFKKLVIADRLFPIVFQLTSQPERYQGIYFLVAMLLYAIAFYGDFTGGIDITMGVAKLFGIPLAENFKTPYLSRSVAEFWRRWHITMGEWFRDYLFYPLSTSPFLMKLSTTTRKKYGNQVGKRVSLYVTTLTVWFATGLWHGATWNFIVWGLVNGVVMLVSQELTPVYGRFHKKFPTVKNQSWYVGFTVVRTFVIMSLIRGFDCYDSVGTTVQMYASLIFSPSFYQFAQEGLSSCDISPIQWVSGLWGTFFLLWVGYLTRGGEEFSQLISEKSTLVRSGILYILLFSTLLLGAYGIGYDSTQFVYRQF